MALHAHGTVVFTASINDQHERAVNGREGELPSQGQRDERNAIDAVV